MLLALTRGVRFRAAAFLAAVALVSFVAPALAVAFASPEAASGCLTHGDHAFGHADASVVDVGSSHDMNHQSPSHEKGDHKSACCGIFCSTALAPDSGTLVRLNWHDSTVSLAALPDFQGLTPEQPDRPPISRLSF